jgi:hypothetical protein
MGRRAQLLDGAVLTALNRWILTKRTGSRRWTSANVFVRQMPCPVSSWTVMRLEREFCSRCHVRVEPWALSARIVAPLGLTSPTRAGFPAGFLSQLENGLVSPSIASLDRIARQLGVTLADFLEASRTPGPP